MTLTACYSMSNEPPTQLSLLAINSLSKITTPIIFTADPAAYFIEDLSAFQTLNINTGFITSISGWCN